jgi:RNA polymerase sigma-70 factor (ECF subfamily)
LEHELQRDIRLARKGHKDAFIRLVRRYEIPMYQVARAILSSDSACADAIQNTILQAYDRIRHLGRKDSFQSWLIRMLIHECRRIQDERKKVIPLDSIRTQPHDEGCAETQALLDAIAALDDDLRVVLNLYYHCDLSVEMIADALRLSPDAVKARLYQARERLALTLDKMKAGGGEHE